MSEPWITKQHLWVKEQYHQGRKVGEFWEEFEPLFGVRRTKVAFYQYVKKIAKEEGALITHHRKEWSEDEIKRLVKLHGVMPVPDIGRALGRTAGSVEGQVAKMRREGALSRKKRVRVCWLSEREARLEREWGV